MCFKIIKTSKIYQNLIFTNFCLLLTINFIFLIIYNFYNKDDFKINRLMFLTLTS
jgi:hypothetical protein